jgi:butyryl-CoA dehydrogenase
MGFIEETGAAQYYRDARILTIYEGTTAIQANDLVGRKTARDGGATARRFVAEIRATAEALAARAGDCAAIGARLRDAADAYDAVIDFVVSESKSDVRSVYAGSVPYLKLAGVVHGGWQMGRAALAAAQRLDDGADVDFHRAKIATARFHADHILVTARALAAAAMEGAAGTLALAEAQF